MKTLLIDPRDDVAVALAPLAAGERFVADGREIAVNCDIPLGHKIAVRAIIAGSSIIKYGYPIGVATAPISPGDHVHSHNLRTALSEEITYVYEPSSEVTQSNEVMQASEVTYTSETSQNRKAAPSGSVINAATFQGFRREDGKAGIRNELWIVPSVGCVNSVGIAIAKMAQKYVGGTLGGVCCFTHPYGCSQLGGDHENTVKALCGLINHPNAGGVLVLGLGCENNSIAGIQEMLGFGETDRVKFLVCQDVPDELAAADAILAELAAYAKRFERVEIPISELIVGLKCGGSDGLSGITANPLVGAFSDMLTAKGGTSILTEVPEMFGAEQLLLNRCENEAVFNKAVSMINSFKNYFIAHGQPIYENPSPGNKLGGITTLEDKSLGCTQKAGKSNVVDVLSYGERVTKRGLNLLDAPGNDLVAATALALSGAHLVLFTTGRGTPFGAPVPTIKISSNTYLSSHKVNWIDFNAGLIATGEPLQSLAAALFAQVRETACGALTKSEECGYRDFAIFKGGVTL